MEQQQESGFHSKQSESFINGEFEQARINPRLSLAVSQRSVAPRPVEFSLYPVLSEGCPVSSCERAQYPLEVGYDYSRVIPELLPKQALSGLDRWQPLLPPIVEGLSMSEGGTPLLRVEPSEEFPSVFYYKDESRNPTWSHKDRLNLIAVSAAIYSGAEGIVVASSGNHGASAAAYAARAGMRAVVIMSEGSDPAIQQFVRAYGAEVITCDKSQRWELMRKYVEADRLHPVSNLTNYHTGHPFGPEGYKTIAYEIFLQLGEQVPDRVFVPTGYGELLFGVWKGFKELKLLGFTDSTPKMCSCESAQYQPLKVAYEADASFNKTTPRASDAHSIACLVNSYRGIASLRESDGLALALTDEELYSAQAFMGKSGVYPELSGAAGVAGYRQRLMFEDYLEEQPDREIAVCIGTSSGLKFS